VANGLRIGVARLEDAECISDALGGSGSEVADDDGAFTVVIPRPAEREMVTALLSALKTCLDENAIASVRVTVDEQSYVMEGTAG